MDKFFILWDIVDPRTESNPNPNANPDPNPDPNCAFIISHKMKYVCENNDALNVLDIVDEHPFIYFSQEIIFILALILRL